MIFTIAGLSVDIKGPALGPVPDVLNKFLARSQKPLKSIHRLDSALFFPKKEFDDRLFSYAYSQILAMNHGLLLHAAAVLKDKRVFLFCGPSGGGKSTVAALSRDHEVLADDVIAVRNTGKEFYAFSTPWRQSGFVRTDGCAKGKISAIFFLKKSKRVYFKPLREEGALVRILTRHIHFFDHTEMPLAGKVFFTAGDFAKRVSAYEMEFRKDEDFWSELEEKLNAC